MLLRIIFLIFTFNELRDHINGFRDQHTVKQASKPCFITDTPHTLLEGFKDKPHFI